ncbi:aldehyde dehydrogenase domain-containing protein [Elsinoe ampelina]|uniref:aldehyde dehydrogenase (NAD(+)) n=1 Tax=Elsinoe ampelina TaxID=302913 RepID=A0A6A6FXJ6_9PEZI|nr:aldehyde dehydrogenase domain-containing protein [Elsinoe ampelina]
MLVARSWCVDGEGKPLTLIKPVDDSVVAEGIPTASKADIDKAVEHAHYSLKKGPWAKFSVKQRAALMLKFADLVEKNAERITYLESLPSDRPIGMILVFDLVHLVEVYRYYAGWADKISGEDFPADNGTTRVVTYEPLCVCAGIASWNATPLYLAWEIAPALAAGNTFIFKPSEKSPLGGLAIAGLYAGAGFPPGVVQFVTGAAETGSLLASHMKISKISFTGFVNGGRAVQEAATKSNLKKVTLELGGKSPAIVYNDAPFNLAVGMVGGGFLENSGQICVAASRVLVQEDIAEKFIAAVKGISEQVNQGLGASPQEKTTSHGPVVDKAQFDRIMSYVELGKKSASLITGGNRKDEKGCFIDPTLFVDPETDSRIWSEAIFGPVLTIKTFKTEEESIEVANDTTYGLAACVYTTDVTRALRVAATVESGCYCRERLLLSRAAVCRSTRPICRIRTRRWVERSRVGRVESWVEKVFMLTWNPRPSISSTSETLSEPAVTNLA